MAVIEIYLIFSMFTILWLDLTKYVIPNWLTASLIVLYPIGVWLADHPVEWKMAVLGMLIVLVVGYGIFAMKWMGGGDIKLLTACTLWVGMKNLPEFIMSVALLGGAMSLLVLFLRKAPTYVPQLIKLKLPRILQDGAPVPYGVAITLGFMLMMWHAEIPVLEHQSKAVSPHAAGIIPSRQSEAPARPKSGD